MNITIRNNKYIKVFELSKASYFLSASAFCLSNLVFSSALFAQGATAGTEISNKVVVTYSIGGTVQAPIESSPSGNSAPGLGNGQNTVFKVDRKIDLLVTGNNHADVSLGESQAEVTFTLTNEGNDTQVFDLAVDSSLSADDFDTNNCINTITSVSGTPLAGVVLPTANSIKLKADQQANIKVSCDIPLSSGGSAIHSGDSSLVSLIATTSKNSDGSNTYETSTSNISNRIDTIFADSNGSDDSDRDARHSARRHFQVSTTTTPPSLAIDKSIVSIVDPQGGNKSVTGAEVTYKINISTAGIGAINNVVISDPTPANMNYKPSSIILDNSNQSDINDSADHSDFGISNANTATIYLGNLAAGAQHEIQITYIIN